MSYEKAQINNLPHDLGQM